MLNCPPVITRNSIVDLIYPVGSYFITESSDFDTVAKVENHFGGTWVQVTETFLYGSTSATNSGTTSQAGEKTHTLTTAEMPAHTHRVWSGTGKTSNSAGLGYSYCYSIGGCDNDTTSKSWMSKTGAKSQPLLENTGGGSAHNNMPPYRTVYMYRRTA